MSDLEEGLYYEEQIRLEPELSEPADYSEHEVTEDDIIQEDL